MKKSTAAACTIYHNPRCSKSRATLALLQEHGITPKVVEYLKTPPTANTIKVLVKQLGVDVGALVRTGEPLYDELFAGKAPTAAQLLAAMAAHPELIERPVVVVGKRAALGRPPENVLQLLK
jgi:arsenate reductase